MALPEELLRPLQEPELGFKLGYYLMLLFENRALAPQFTDVSLEL